MILAKKSIYYLFILFKIALSQLTNDCGTTFGCFLNPANCKNDECSTILKWRDRGTFVEFLLTSNSTTISNFDSYNAVGLSYDNFMGEDSVTMCRFSLKTSTYRVETYYNRRKSVDVLDPYNRTLGIFNTFIRLNQTYLICGFSRVKNLPNAPDFYDLNYPYYLLVAFGATNSLGSPTYHKNNSFSSNSVVNFQINNVVSPYSYPVATTTLSTILNGQYSNEEFTLKWTNYPEWTQFEFSTLLPFNENIWSAFAFSTDRSMGNDDVALCRINNNQATIEHLYNTGKSMPNLLLSNQATIGFSNILVTYQNGMLKCSFIRLKRMVNIQNYFDLANDYYLLTAWGRVDNGVLRIHDKKLSSSQMIDFESSSSIVDEKTSIPRDKIAKAKAHGCLMVIAWIFFASTGILFSRYYKYLFPKSKLCGVQFWFFAHRPIMIMVPVISITAFIVILAKCDWKWISTSEPVNYTHSIFGIVAISFSVFQVFVALLRPQNSHPKRFIFNFFHRLIGYSSFIFSIVAMFLGVVLEEMNLGRLGWGLVLGWTLWCIILPLLIEIFRLLFGIRKVVYEVDENQENLEQRRNSILARRKVYRKIYETLKSIFMVIHLIIAFGFTIALIVVIGIAEENRFD